MIAWRDDEAKTSPGAACWTLLMFRRSNCMIVDRTLDGHSFSCLGPSECVERLLCQLFFSLIAWTLFLQSILNNIFPPFMLFKTLSQFLVAQIDNVKAFHCDICAEDGLPKQFGTMKDVSAHQMASHKIRSPMKYLAKEDGVCPACGTSEPGFG